jgi:hypothetical protein
MVVATQCLKASLHQPVFFAHPGSLQIVEGGSSGFGHLNAPHKGERLKAQLAVFGKGSVDGGAQVFLPSF